MKLVVGLGNPGPKYVGTRHNVGFEVMDVLAGRFGSSFGGEKFHAFFATATVADEKVALLKPTTFMNRSGRAVLAAGRFYKLEIEDLLVVVDDLALPVGKLRLRPDGSAGSHNGLQDIIDRIGSQGFCRLRIGIGDAVGEPSVYVLTRFEKRERETVDVVVQQAADAVECWLRSGCQAAMNQFN